MPQANVVVLAGDIQNGILWVQRAAQHPHGKSVVLLAGNHGFDFGHSDRTVERMRAAAAEAGIHLF